MHVCLALASGGQTGLQDDRSVGACGSWDSIPVPGILGTQHVYLPHSIETLKLKGAQSLFATPWNSARLLSPCSSPGKNTGVGSYSITCNSPGKNTGVGSYSLLQGIFPTPGSNPGLLHCRQILYRLNHQGSHDRNCMLFSCGRTWESEILKEGSWVDKSKLSVNSEKPRTPNELAKESCHGELSLWGSHLCTLRSRFCWGAGVAGGQQDLLSRRAAQGVEENEN